MLNFWLYCKSHKICKIKVVVLQQHLPIFIAYRNANKLADSKLYSMVGCMSYFDTNSNK